MMKQPKVSIVIPVYNGSNYLREAIDSALNQTYENCEIIVVNDGSCDGGKTEEIALSYGTLIRYFKKENGGVASALNMGIMNMEGEYFSWLSHDDVYYPNKIKAEIEAILASGDPTKLVQCEYDFYEESTGTYTPTDFSKAYTMEQLTNSVFTVLQLQIHACCALIHRSHFERVGVFDESIKTVQDIEMWFRLFRNQRSLFVPISLYKVRDHAEAGNHTNSVYREETCSLYQRLLFELSEEEINAIWGSCFRFYVRMFGYLKSYGVENEVLLEKLAVLMQSESDKNNTNHLRDVLDKKKIYVFGAGQYGIRIQNELKYRSIFIDGFIDNNCEKEGKEINGVKCFLPNRLEQEKQDFVVVTSIRNDKRIIEQLRDMGTENVLRKQDIEKIMFHIEES